MIRRVCIVNIVLYSRFIWLNGSITLIRAETERYDIVRFLRWPLSLWPREQALGSQMNQARATFQVNFDLGQDFCRPCDCTSGNLNKTSVRQKFGGVYLPIGWVFTSYSTIFCLCQTSEDYAWLFIVSSVPRKCLIVWFLQGVDRYVVALLSRFAKIFCASHKNVSSVFRFPDCTLEKQLSTQGNCI